MWQTLAGSQTFCERVDVPQIVYRLGGARAPFAEIGGRSPRSCLTLQATATRPLSTRSDASRTTSSSPTWHQLRSGSNTHGWCCFGIERYLGDWLVGALKFKGVHKESIVPRCSWRNRDDML